ncbi:MAG: hypothetical protein PSU94_01300 [Lacunisphaera sp.]|nr:hypothetical protein [Lacunisphaera sp.]
MKLQFKFNPSLHRELAPGDRRFWLLRAVALRIERQANPVWRLEIFHRRLLIALGALAVAGWLLAASALFLWLNAAPRNQVGWLDLAAPWRWSGLRARRGDTAVLTALDELKAQDYPSAFYNLRVGLSRSPGNVDGRFTLARLQAGYDPARAVTLMEEGIPVAGHDPKFIAGLFSIYASQQIQAHALEVADRLLQDLSLPAGARSAVQRARVALLLQAARYPEAEATLAAMAPSTTPAERAGFDGLQIELLLRSGRAAGARQYAESHPAADAADIGRLRQAAEIAIARGDADALQSALRRLKAKSPDTPGAYLFAFQAWHRMKRLSFRDAAEQEYLQSFGGNDGALQALAALAVNLDLPEIVSRARSVAVANRLSAFAYRVHLTELALRRGEIETAMRRLRDWENTIDTLKNPQRFYPEFIKRLARAAFAGTPEQVNFLLAHLAAGRGQMLLPVYQLAAMVLEKSGNLAGADQVLRAGLQLYPLSDPLLTASARVAAALPAATEKKGAGAVDATPAAAAFVILPGTPAEARKQLDELLQKDSLAEARDLLRAIRAQKPAWLSLVETEVSLREVELAFLTLDQVASRSAARAYLDHYRTDDDVLRLVALVPRLVARDHLADARLLADEIAAAPTATARVKQALHDLNLADDLAALVADQAAAVSELDRWILAQEWAQAERLLKSLRDKPPAWLATGAADVKVREVQVRLGLDQRPLALAALKELVIKGGAPRSLAFKLVRDQLARGERDNAALVAREILKLLPDDPAAARLVKEAETPRPAD